MSRIGRLPIPVPSGVDVDITDRVVTVKGPKGTLTHTLADPILIEKGDDGALHVTRPDDEKRSKERHGLSRTLVANMVTGVTDGFSKTLEIVGTGYRVQAKGSDLEFALGFSHPV
ncbi:MAG TPA: 50S ribosomal protein L6, partial [Acidothermaceae bacterium]